MRSIEKVGLTGANGTIGRVLMEGLANEYELMAFTRREVDFASAIVNFENAAEVEGSFAGLDAVIHLAADPSPLAPWEAVREHAIPVHSFSLNAFCSRLLFTGARARRPRHPLPAAAQGAPA